MDRGSFFIEVHHAQLDDAPLIARLSAQLGYPASGEQIRERLASMQAEPDTHGVFVADVAGHGIIGWAHVYMLRSLVSEPRAELGGLVVDEEWRGTGVGRALIAGVEQWARNRGLRALSLRSNIVREEAHRFYEWLDFEKSKTQIAFRKEISQ